MNQIVETSFAVIQLESPRIVWIQLKDISPNCDEIKEFFVELETYIDKVQGNFVIILDGSQMKWLALKAKIELGRKAQYIERKYKERLMKGFVVAPNIVLKLIFEGFNMVLQPEIEQEICESYEEALSKSRKFVQTLS